MNNSPFNYRMRAERIIEIAMCMIEQKFDYQKDMEQLLISSAMCLKIDRLERKKDKSLGLPILMMAINNFDFWFLRNNITFNNEYREVNCLW